MSVANAQPLQKNDDSGEGEHGGSRPAPPLPARTDRESGDGEQCTQTRIAKQALGSRLRSSATEHALQAVPWGEIGLVAHGPNRTAAAPAPEGWRGELALDEVHGLGLADRAPPDIAPVGIRRFDRLGATTTRRAGALVDVEPVAAFELAGRFDAHLVG